MRHASRPFSAYMAPTPHDYIKVVIGSEQTVVVLFVFCVLDCTPGIAQIQELQRRRISRLVHVYLQYLHCFITRQTERLETPLHLTCLLFSMSYPS